MESPSLALVLVPEFMFTAVFVQSLFCSSWYSSSPQHLIHPPSVFPMLADLFLNDPQDFLGVLDCCAILDQHLLEHAIFRLYSALSVPGSMSQITLRSRSCEFVVISLNLCY